jgi:hypothetical protein
MLKNKLPSPAQTLEIVGLPIGGTGGRKVDSLHSTSLGVELPVKAFGLPAVHEDRLDPRSLEDSAEVIGFRIADGAVQGTLDLAAVGIEDRVDGMEDPMGFPAALRHRGHRTSSLRFPQYAVATMLLFLDGAAVRKVSRKMTLALGLEGAVEEL